MPVENMVYANQQQYYDAISASTNMGQCEPFIDFMLGDIQKTLETHKGEPLQEVPDKVPNKVPNKLREAFPLSPDSAWVVYNMLEDDGTQTSAHLSERIGISERMVRKYNPKCDERSYQMMRDKWHCHFT